MGIEHLNGKRTGRPKGKRNGEGSADLRKDLMWAYRNMGAFTLKDGKAEPVGDRRPRPPSPGAMLWVENALKNPDRFLEKVYALGELEKDRKQETETEIVDEGTDRVQSQIDSLLDGFRKTRIKEGMCATCGRPANPIRDLPDEC